MWQMASRWELLAWTWQVARDGLPDDVTIVDGAGRDAGLRFVDLDRDGYDDIVFSNEERYAVYRYDPKTSRFGNAVRSGLRSDADAVPMIVRRATNNGAWFAEGSMWVQNENTDRLPDGVQRMTFEEMLGTTGRSLAEPVVP